MISSSGSCLEHGGRVRGRNGVFKVESTALPDRPHNSGFDAGPRHPDTTLVGRLTRWVRRVCPASGGPKPRVAKGSTTGHSHGMKEALRVGRNAPCPCGSGGKFKHCCAGKASLPPVATRSPVRYGVMAVATVGLAMILGKTIFAPSASERTGGASPGNPSGLSQQGLASIPGARANGLTAQPPGPPPPGKVWSPEHGHWHDIETTAAGGQVSSATVGLTPQPPGPAPEGKVWSPEHGHWHDVPTAAPAIPVGSELLNTVVPAPLDPKPQLP